MKTKIELQLIGHRAGKDWPHYLINVSIGSEHFEYRVGEGWYTPAWEPRSRKMNKKPLNSVKFGDGWVKMPSQEEVLSCLFDDGLAAEMSFDNFCDDFGYSNDSISAFNTYQACAKNGRKLKKALAGEYNEVYEHIMSLRNAGTL